MEVNGIQTSVVGIDGENSDHRGPISLLRWWLVSTLGDFLLTIESQNFVAANQGGEMCCVIPVATFLLENQILLKFFETVARTDVINQWSIL